MKLKTHLEQQNMTVTAFAAKAGLEIATVWRAANEKVTPSPRTMRAIAAASGGEVTPNDFVM